MDFAPSIKNLAAADVTERTCTILFEDACIRRGYDLALSGGGNCAKILTYGPDESANDPNCPDYNAALRIFRRTLDGACTG